MKRGGTQEGDGAEETYSEGARGLGKASCGEQGEGHLREVEELARESVIVTGRWAEMGDGEGSMASLLTAATGSRVK